MSESNVSSEPALSFNLVRKAILFCACVNNSVMKECKTAVIYYYLIGTFVLITTATASVTGYFAATKLTNGNQAVSIIIAAFWAFIIFSVDRSIIISLTKKSSTPIWMYAAIASVRIGIAIGVSLLIGMLFEIMIFSKDILDMRSKMTLAARAANIKDSQNAVGLGKLEKTAGNLKKEFDSLDKIKNNDPDDDLFKANKSRHEEAELLYRGVDHSNSAAIVNIRKDIRHYEEQKITANDTRVIELDGLIAERKKNIKALNRDIEAKKNAADDLLNILTNARNTYHTEINERINTIKPKRDSAIKQQQAASDTATKLQTDANKKSDVKYDDNLIAGFKALSELKDEKEDGAYYTRMGYMIMGIIMFIELLPLLFKLFLPQTSYEEKIETIENDIHNEEAGKRTLNDKHYEKLTNDISQLTEIRFQSEIDKENKLKEKRKEVVDGAIDKIATSQTFLIDAYVEAWRENELTKAEEQIAGFKKQFKKQKKALFVNKLWKDNKADVDHTYYFTEETAYETRMKLIQTIDDKKFIASWEYNPFNEELFIQRDLEETFYLIETFDLKSNSLILIEQRSREKLEFSLI